MWHKSLVPTSALPVTAQVSGKRALPAGLPWSSLFPASSLRASWSLLCKTCEEKHWVWDTKEEPTNVLSSETATLVPASKALLCLAQSNQCADYCTTALSWTGSLNTGPTGQELQKLPSGPLKSSLSPWEQLLGSPPWSLLHWLSPTPVLWFSVLTWHICCRLGNWQWI